VTNQTLKLSFCLAVILFAVFHFAENTADPDLWGHVLFGQRMLNRSSIDTVEPFSWTAAYHPWINHEVLAEIALGLAHSKLGGSGLLLLKLFVGMLTFWIALSLGGRELAWPERAVAWFVGLIAVVEISFGFAARPQIFTALALVSELWILCRIHTGKKKWAMALPILFALWINTHGGVVVGLGVLATAVGVSTVQALGANNGRVSAFSMVPGSVVLWLWLGAGLSIGALWINPWGGELPRWLVSSILWQRPEIEEWKPAPLGWDHGPLFILLFLSIVTICTTKRHRAAWEIAVLVLLGFAALKYVRNAPLFAIAVLAFVPPYLVDLFRQAREWMSGTRAFFSRPVTQWVATGCFLVLAAFMLRAAFTLHKVNGLTMEVPTRQYPVFAVRFIQDYGLSGNILVYFDWGELCLWELPDCPPSIDGRLDTCYSRDVISANWRLYNGQEVDSRALGISKAELALLPRQLAGVQVLIQEWGWKAVYVDPLAVVLVRQPNRFPRLFGLSLPVIMGDDVMQGREPFPDHPSRRIGKGK
jgi:hypothetical protein